MCHNDVSMTQMSTQQGFVYIEYDDDDHDYYDIMIMMIMMIITIMMSRWRKYQRIKAMCINLTWNKLDRWIDANYFNCVDNNSMDTEVCGDNKDMNDDNGDNVGTIEISLSP